MKRCSACSLEKPLSDFLWNKSRSRYYAFCRECSNRRHREAAECIRREVAGTLPEKRCWRCKIILPIEEFAWKEPRTKGRSATCDACLSPDGTKRCGRCQQIKPKADFKYRDDKNCWHAFCRHCEAEYNRDWNRAKYSVSPEGFASLEAEQDGCCAICGKWAQLRVDHDHSCCPRKQSCGKCLRGLLCDLCNKGLGQFLDNPKILRQAAEYLERWMAGRPPLELFSVEEVSGEAVLCR